MIKANKVLAASFTFHNVSINSDATTDTEDLRYSFTFHNVSINSGVAMYCLAAVGNLHSTMFLLIRPTVLN